MARQRCPGCGARSAMYSNRQSPLYLPKCPTKDRQEVWFTAVRISRDLLIVDWPLHLRESPAPFTSRSPGIATLRPSWTPDRQWGLYFQTTFQRRKGSDVAHFQDVVRTGSWSVERRRWESNPLGPDQPAVGARSRLPCRLAQASMASPARQRTDDALVSHSLKVVIPLGAVKIAPI